MNRCATCKHWEAPEDRWDNIVFPLDPDTYERMETGFEVRMCLNPKLMFCERPLESNGFALADGSGYKANLYTAEDFGCVRWEAK